MAHACQFRKAILYLLAIFPIQSPAFCLPEATAQTRAPDPRTENSENLLTTIWNGVQEAQIKYSTGCGKVTETRSSRLLTRPLIFRGKFCASGMKRFSLEYSEPEALRLVFNEDYLNVSTGKERSKTEVFKIGDYVRRTQQYFSKDNSLKNLKGNFIITAREYPAFYEMKLVPRSQRFKQRVNYVVVRLRKGDFLLRSFEIDGRSGVNSIFTIEIDSLNQKVSDELYRVYKP